MLPDAYGCVVANRFQHLLDDADDPLDRIRTEEEEGEARKRRAEERKARQRRPGQRESQKDRRVPGPPQGPDLQPVRKQPVQAAETGRGKEQPRGAAKAAALRDLQAGQMEQVFQEPPFWKPSFGPDASYRGRGGGRGRRGARDRGGYARTVGNLTPGGKREFDRQSASGVSPAERRGGRGRWNWGAVGETASELMETATEGRDEAEELPAAAGEEERSASAAEEEEEEMVVQVAMEMTLDEWRALQEPTRPKMEFNIRKAADKIPSKARVIHQSRHKEYLKEVMDQEGTFLRRSVNDITSLMDINFGSLGRPGRGGRGRAASGRPAGPTESGGRTEPEKGDDVAPDPDNPDEFPALSREQITESASRLASAPGETGCT